MAARLIRVLLAALLALAILVVGGTGLALLAFNPNAFKSALISAVQQRYHRRLELPGRLQLHLLPPFTLQTGPMRLSATDGHTPFAQAADMRLHLDPLRLLRRQVVIDGIELDSPRLQLQRDSAGRWNFSDLLTPPGSKVPSLAVHNLRVRDGDIALSDALHGIDGRLGGVYADASGIGLAGWHALSARGRAVLASSRTDAQFNLRGQLHADPGGAASLRNLVLRSDGSLLGGARMLSNLRADVDWSPAPTRSLQVHDLQLRAQGRMNDGQPLQLEVSEPLLEWRETWTRAAAWQGWALIGAAPRTLRLGVQGGPLDGPGADLVVSGLRLDLHRAAPQALDLQLEVGAHLDLPSRSAVLDTLETHGAWGSPPRRWQAHGQGSYVPAQGLQLHLQGQYAGAAADVDARYTAGAWTLQGHTASLDLAGGAAPADWQDMLALLRRLPAGQARLQVDTAHWNGLRLSALTAQAHVDETALHLDQLRAGTCGGELSVRADMGRRGQQAALHASLNHASMAQLLDALYGRSAIDGEAQLGADLTWSAGRDGALHQTGGSASLQLRAGRLHGVDLRTGDAAGISAGASTAFTRLDAKASVAGGVAQLLQLQLQLPGSGGEWRGSGSVDLPGRRLQLVLGTAGGPRPVPAAHALHIGGSPAQPMFAWQSPPSAGALSYSPK